MTSAYEGNDFWSLQFDNGMKVLIKQDEIKEIVEDFVEFSDKFEEMNDVIFRHEDEKAELEEEIEKLKEELDDVIKLHQCKKGVDVI